MDKPNNLQLVRFEKNNIPEPIESKNSDDSRYITWGNNNLYPNYLLHLYNSSPIHASIINAKTNFIIGDGLKYADGKDVDFNVNDADNIKEFANKIVKDYLIFNAFAVEVCFNGVGEAIEFHHVPVQKLRTNKSKNMFWFNHDWCYTTRTYLKYERLSKNNQDSTSKIFYYDGYFPSIHNIYPQPEYHNLREAIETDIAIRKFNLNNIKNHFSVSTVISFFQGANISEEQKAAVIKQLKESYTGEEGKKMIVDFQERDGKGAEVKNISSNDWADAYEQTRQAVQDDIMIGHQVTSPILFGVKTEGQIGGNTELETSYEIFKGNYIRVKRDELEAGLNQLFSINKNFKQKLAFADKPLFNSVLSESMKEKVMTINEIRKEAGLAAIPNGDRLISEIPHVSESLPNTSPAAPATNQPAPVVQEEDVKKKNSRKLTEADYELIKDMGLSEDEFDVVGKFESGHFHFGKEEDIAQYVISNDIKNLSISELNNLIQKDTGLKTSVNELQSILKHLNDSGVIKVSIDDKNNISILPNKTADVPKSDAVTVMYKYEKRPNVPGGDLVPESRSFCVKLIENKRLYTRQEIQQMSQIFEYDVYQYAGGFYHNPDTDKTTPYCRHQWVAYSVKRRTTVS